ncbi:MAG: molybdopterin-synthase adenylyltransferase MoeB [Elusimicrobia bacterium]|nr:molybdopterin-synthase adenylyltransferase MoeB [Elusimicrobiota bacterium]
MASPMKLPELTTEELTRYGRQIVLPELGPEGQRKLKAARVLVVGAGGLGAPASLYLAAAGVGTIGLADADEVELGNLHRQILYSDASVGKPKLAEAEARLRALNPSVKVVAHDERLTARNALGIVKSYDVVADGTDNFPARYLVNDACVLAGKPDVYAAVFRFEGRLSVFDARRGPCYRCLFPQPPAPGTVPDCAAGGVLGALPGVMGSLQAVEAMKLVLGTGEPAVGKLVVFDALAMEWQAVTLRKDPRCPLCGKKPSIRGLKDLEYSCAAAVPETSVEDLKARLDRKEALLLLDVREPGEHDLARIPGAKLIPLGQLPARLKELAAYRRKPVLVHCKTGARSAQAVGLLRAQGFSGALNVAGGIAAWSERIDPSVPKY